MTTVANRWAARNRKNAAGRLMAIASGKLPQLVRGPTSSLPPSHQQYAVAAIAANVMSIVSQYGLSSRELTNPDMYSATTCQWWSSRRKARQVAVTNNV